MPRIELGDVKGVSLHFEEKPAEGGQAPRLVILEKHPLGGDFHTLMVQMSPAPKRAAHRYYPEVRMIRHEFEYDPSLSDRIESFEFRFASRAKLAADAVTLKAPLEIDTLETQQVSPANELDE